MSLSSTKRCLLLGTAMLIGMCAQNACADSYKLENRTLKPRLDLTARGGTGNHRIGTISGWAPLAQDADRVLYSDLRFTRQNSDDNEANVGIGYRQLSTDLNAVVGGHLWYDNRHTSNGTTVHQVTAGAEYMSDTLEARFNAYAPVASHTRTFITSNVGSATPYLSGNGIYVDTAGFIIEEPQPGFDLEVGTPFTPAEKYVDSLRFYMGGYAFFGDDTPDVRGVRFRLLADVNPALQVGIRTQNDVRGAQAYLEATLRLPFSAKLAKREQGLRSHLDESPQRDIDIVTGTVIETGIAKPVLNETTEAVQTVWFVDNTAGAGGTGTKENPFNTLKDVEAVLKDHDIVYIAQGDGTSARQDQGLTISRNDVQVIGAGVNFVYDDARFKPSAGNYTGSGAVLAAATANPVITNTAGRGVMVTGDDAYLTGFSVDGAMNDGVYANAVHNFTATNLNITQTTGNGFLANGALSGNFLIRDLVVTNTITDQLESVYFNINGVDVDSIDIDNVTASLNGNNASMGINLTNGANVDTLTLQNSRAFHNVIGGANDFGVNIGLNNSSIGTLNVHDNEIYNNEASAIRFATAAGSQIDHVSFAGNNFHHNTGGGGIGLQMLHNGSNIDDLTITGNTASANSAGGLWATASNNATIGDVTISGNTVTTTANRGIYLQMASGADITGLTAIANNNSGTNTGGNGRGIQVESTGTGSTIGDVDIHDNITNGNVSQGIYVTASATGAIGNVTLTDNTANGNTNTTNGTGIMVEATASGSTVASVEMDHNTTNTNGNSGQFVNINAGAITGLVNIHDGTASFNTGNGVRIENTAATGSAGTVTVNGMTLDDNDSNGVFVRNQVSGQMGTLNVTGNNIDHSTVNGIQLTMLSNADIGTVNITGNDIDTTTTQGIRVEMGGANTTITTGNLNNNTVTGSGDAGLYLRTNTDADITTLNINNNHANSNAVAGIRVDSTATGSTVTTLNMNNNETNTNDGRGILLATSSVGRILNANLTGNTANGNTGANGFGIDLEANGNAGTTITNVNLTNNIATNNAQQGIYLFANTAASMSSSLTHNTVTGNGLYGIFINDDTTGTFVADMGGGALGSTGNNRVFSNTNTELRVDLDGGQLKAENNWWGVNTGLGGGEITVDSASTVDSAPFLGTDPGP